MRKQSEAETIASELRAASDPAKAAFFPRFFKTGPGEYGEGDRFLGVTVPKIRAIVRRHRQAPEAEILKLLRSPYHEERQAALLILLSQYDRGDAPERERIYRLYMKSTGHVHSWDLVDLSAPNIVGRQLYRKNCAALTRLAQSRDLWERRIAMLSTYYFIRQGESREALRIAELLLGDAHDLIHKAVGWMLREVGKRCSLEAACGFLDKHAAVMPRTMLRYAVERLPETMRRRYMRARGPAP